MGFGGWWLSWVVGSRLWWLVAELVVGGGLWWLVVELGGWWWVVVVVGRLE